MLTFGKISLWWIHTWNDDYINLYLYMDSEICKLQFCHMRHFPHCIPHILYHFLKWIQENFKLHVVKIQWWKIKSALWNPKIVWFYNLYRILIIFFYTNNMTIRYQCFFCICMSTFIVIKFTFFDFSDYSCAYIGDILLHGSIYISQNWICFYSKIRARGRRVRNS